MPIYCATICVEKVRCDIYPGGTYYGNYSETWRQLLYQGELWLRQQRQAGDPVHNLEAWAENDSKADRERAEPSGGHV